MVYLAGFSSKEVVLQEEADELRRAARQGRCILNTILTQG
jgi:hypothetical protein